MNAIKVLSIAVLCGSWTLAAAQDAEEDQAQQDPPAQDAPPRPAQPPAGGQQRGSSDDVFIPSEELGADEEVTFPVDI